MPNYTNGSTPAPTSGTQHAVGNPPAAPHQVFVKVTMTGGQQDDWQLVRGGGARNHELVKRLHNAILAAPTVLAEPTPPKRKLNPDQLAQYRISNDNAFETITNDMQRSARAQGTLMAHCRMAIAHVAHVNMVGIPKDVYDAAFRKGSRKMRPDVGLRCSLRAEELIDIAGKDKRVALDVMQGKKLEEMAYSPREYLNLKFISSKSCVSHAKGDKRAAERAGLTEPGDDEEPKRKKLKAMGMETSAGMPSAPTFTPSGRAGAFPWQSSDDGESILTEHSPLSMPSLVGFPPAQGLPPSYASNVSSSPPQGASSVASGDAGRDMFTTPSLYPNFPSQEQPGGMQRYKSQQSKSSGPSSIPTNFGVSHEHDLVASTPDTANDQPSTPSEQESNMQETESAPLSPRTQDLLREIDEILKTYPPRQSPSDSGTDSGEVEDDDIDSEGMGDDGIDSGEMDAGINSWEMEDAGIGSEERGDDGVDSGEMNGDGIDHDFFEEWFRSA